MKHAAFLIAALLLSACQPTYTLELYDGPQREDEHVATIVPLRGCFHCVQWIRLTGKHTAIYTYPVKESRFDTPAVPEKFRVPPGRYEVQIAASGYGRPADAYWVGEVDLEPGHTYQVKTDDCRLICWGTYNALWQTWVWMEEAATGDVLLGLRIPQNDAEGAKWNLYAAERGNYRYQYRIGLMYEEGRGVPRDYVRAYMWYSLAVTNGWEWIAHDRDQIAEKMTPDQIAEAQRLAREWKLLSGYVSSEQLDGDGKWVGRAVQRPRKAKCFGPKMEVSIDRGLMKGAVSEFGFGVPTIELNGNLDSRGALNATGDEFGLNGMLHRYLGSQDVIVGTWHFATLECKGTFTLKRWQPASKSSGTPGML